VTTCGLPSLALCTRTLGTFQPLFCGGILRQFRQGHSAQLEPWNCSLWRTTIELSSEWNSSKLPTAPTGPCDNMGLALTCTVHQNTRNIPAIVLWWYPATVQIGTLRAVGTLELFPLENNSIGSGSRDIPQPPIIV
jgi:hypothetical protein